ncbi:hypothetical protein [Streptomyces sp. NRRL B-24572]|uniref:hypothetical protein n=1 Tax=Streptomyces sp. NRRL B-24572 TaxID=1962156 RepID=UPI00117DA37F|nr:hypothetical protein [Streptomyces sp. NRRL B-24572]
MLAACWAVCGLGGAWLPPAGEGSPPVAFLVVLVLVHRDWAAGVLAGCVGFASVFGAVELLRPVTGRAVADPLATGLGASVSVVVFTVFARARTVRAGGPNV